MSKFTIVTLILLFAISKTLNGCALALTLAHPLDIIGLCVSHFRTEVQHYDA